MKKTMAAILALQLMLGISLPVLAQDQNSTFTVPVVTATDLYQQEYNQVEIVQLKDSGQTIDSGQMLVFQTHRELDDSYELPPTATVTMTVDSNATFTNIQLTNGDASVFKVENLSKTTANTGDQLTFDVSLIRNDLEGTGHDVITVSGEKDGQAVTIGELQVAYHIGAYLDEHGQDTVFRWISGLGIMTDLTTEIEYRIVGEVSTTDTQQPVFAFTFHPMTYTHLPDSNGYVKKLHLNPDDIFTFADGSYSYDVPARQSPVQIKLVMKQDALDAIRAGQVNLGFYQVSSLIMEFDDGCMFGGPISPLLLVFNIKQGSSGGGGSSSGGGGGGGTVQNPLLSQARTETDTDVKSSISKALNASQGDTSIRLKNVKSINPAMLKDAAAAAKKAGRTITLYIDKVEKKVVVSRFYINLQKAAQLTSSINAEINTDTAETKAVQKLFEKNFTNEMKTMSLSQEGAFGMDMDIAVQMDLSKMDVKNLHLYYYDTTTKRYTKVEGKLRADSNYFYFTANKGGMYILSSGELQEK